mmetsp:Transcript_165173/g.292534  ORF Transcript_165173/g.292534 Transcript_165173/m.292534 type:complete len:434 (-) Transcript_165173:10-1311(-)
MQPWIISWATLSISYAVAPHPLMRKAVRVPNSDMPQNNGLVLRSDVPPSSWNRTTGYAHQPLTSCAQMNASVHAGDPPNQNFRKALTHLCTNHRLAMLWLEPGFEQNYRRWYGADGWANDAFITYFALHANELNQSLINPKLQEELQVLIESVHSYSAKPIIAVNFGDDPTPLDWAPKKFPNLVVLRGFPLATVGQQQARFNLNKFRALILTRARTGVQLDADQFVVRGVDNLFQRTREEVTRRYPYPILPVHFMSRDDVSSSKYAKYNFQCERCPARTMRWAQAHPTYTHWALPFMGRWLGRALTGRIQKHFGSTEGTGDEGIWNFALWAENATKQWCKHDIPGSDVYHRYLAKDTRALQHCCTYEDEKWYPSGVPLVFYTAHAATDSRYTQRVLHAYEQAKEVPPPVFFQGRFFKSGSELREAHPEVRCII